MRTWTGSRICGFETTRGDFQLRRRSHSFPVNSLSLKGMGLTLNQRNCPSLRGGRSALRELLFESC